MTLAANYSKLYLLLYTVDSYTLYSFLLILTMPVDQRLFQPSGLNNQFNGNNSMPFTDYLQQTRTMLARGRIDLTPDNNEKILQANSPFDWRSGNETTAKKRGVLLIHGLYDSPFTMRDIGSYLLQQGYQVRSILLPGHGTVPGDLLNINYLEWLKAVDYGVDTLASEVDELFLAGYSMGALLAIHKALQDTRMRGLVLISPALQIQHQRLLAGHIVWCKYTSKIFTPCEWYRQRLFQQDYTKYESFTYNSAIQIYALLTQVNTTLKTTLLNIPIFMAVSAQDDIVSPNAALQFFNRQQLANNRAVVYSRIPLSLNDPRISVKTSCFSEKKILDFSHIALPFSPENSHYGVQGDYQDFLRYADNRAPASERVFLGATLKRNMKGQVLQRLTYNPDFPEMASAIGKFLASC